MRFEAAIKKRMRRTIMDRGLVLATLLSDALAGKLDEGRLAELVYRGKPGARPAEKLRWALDQVERRRILLDSDDDRFGRCDVCGADLGEVQLDQMPWADRCEEHRAV